MKKNIFKIIKFKGPSKISTGKGDDFLNKIKPVLGQNQINPVLFTTEYNKKTEILVDGIELLSQVLKMKDKSLQVIIKNYNPTLIAEQLSSNKVLNICLFQDLIKIKVSFDNKTSTVKLFKKNLYKDVAKQVLSTLKNYQITL